MVLLNVKPLIRRAFETIVSKEDKTAELDTASIWLGS